MVSSFGWEVVMHGGHEKREPGKTWKSYINAVRGSSRFVLVDVECEPKPVKTLLPYYGLPGSAYYRDKQCTLTARVTQGQDGLAVRTESKEMVEKLLDTIAPR